MKMYNSDIGAAIFQVETLGENRREVLYVSQTGGFVLQLDTTVMTEEEMIGEVERK